VSKGSISLVSTTPRKRVDRTLYPRIDRWFHPLTQVVLTSLPHEVTRSTKITRSLTKRISV